MSRMCAKCAQEKPKICTRDSLESRYDINIIEYLNFDTYTSTPRRYPIH